MTNTDTVRAGKKPNRIPPFSLRLTKEEREKLESRAGNIPLGAYIKSLIFAEDAPVYRKRRKAPVKDRKALADLLAALGASHIAQSMSQLAKAASIGDLYFDEDTKRLIARACEDIKAMRQMLMRALGLQITDAPAKESPTQSFARQAAPVAKAVSVTTGKRFGL